MSNLKASPREVVGKKVKTLRKDMLVPAVLYGPSFESMNVTLDKVLFVKTFAKAGYSNLIDIDIEGKGTEKVLVKEVQIHPTKDTYLHASLYVIDSKKEIGADIPLNVVGMSPAEDLGLGFVITAVYAVSVKCLPADLPSEIEVSIETLENPGDAITVGDIKLPKGVSLDSKMEATTAVAYVATAQKVEESEEGEEGEEGESAEGEESTEGESE